jgi:hypothetical protein
MFEPGQLINAEKDILKFKEQCIQLFHFQYEHNAIYKQYVDLLGLDLSELNSLDEIPFIPIQFFKLHKITTGDDHIDKIFKSSGTGGSRSKHYVKDINIYKRACFKGFEFFYGPPGNYCFLALLPSYLENESSSLIYMVDHFITASKYSDSGYYLYDHQSLINKLSDLEKHKIPVILIGVSFALADLAAKYELNLKHTTIMETGGMKGRRKEITRMELHELLCSSFHQETIHSEYGMSELLSQAYSKGRGIFYPPPWMKIFIRDMYDPFNYLPPGKTGGINIIDLANVFSCAFIETQDLGRLNNDGSFEVLGRFDESDIRGCNLMIG